MGLTSPASGLVAIFGRGALEEGTVVRGERLTRGGSLLSRYGRVLSTLSTFGCFLVTEAGVL